MSDVDTAAVRDFLGTSDFITLTREMVLALCDALEVAQAERCPGDCQQEDLAEAKRALSKRIAADNGYRVLYAELQDRIDVVLGLTRDELDPDWQWCAGEFCHCRYLIPLYEAKLTGVGQ